MQDFSCRSFTASSQAGHSICHDVYTKGDQAASVVVMQELPGIGPETISLANTLHEGGFRVVVPHLFGRIGRLNMLGNLVRVFCMRREFRLFAKNQSSPIVDWLKALCRDLKENHDATGVGVIGMCLTGNFAISLMADKSVLAGVASQPSLPLFQQSALHMSAQEIQQARDRLDEHGPMMGLRFQGDSICQHEKFEAIERAFNDDRERIRLTEIPGDGHSVLTRDLIEGGEPTLDALQEMLAYFTSKLKQ